MIRPKTPIARVERVRNNQTSRLGLLRLDKNENPLPASPALMDAIMKRLTPEAVSAYPEVFRLYDALADHLGLKPENLYVSAGSDAAIKAAFEVFVEPGDTVCALEPSYAMYTVYADIFQARMLGIQYDRDLAIDRPSLEAALGAGAKLAVIANPNSPTGTMIPSRDLAGLIGSFGEQGTCVLVDEAYFGFYGESALGWIDDFDNLVVTRTFSKSMGLGGARLGFAAANERLAELLHKVRPMYEINAFAVAAGLAVLEHPELVREMAEAYEEGKRYLLAGLEQAGLRVLPFAGNFALIRVGSSERAVALERALKDRGILVRADFRHPAMEGCLRVTVGAKPCMRRLLDAFVPLLGEL